MLAVAGVDRDGIASQEASTQGITIGVAAPSEDLIGVTSDGRIAEWDGTSAAAPIVAGIAALVRAEYPELNAGQIINRLLATAEPVGSGESANVIYGHGIVNAYAAVTAHIPTADADPSGQLREWIRLYRRAAPDNTPPSVGPPLEVPPLPPPDHFTEASPFVPSRESLLYGTLPLVAVTLPGILIALGVSAAVRRIRALRTERARAPRVSRAAR